MIATVSAPLLFCEGPDKVRRCYIVLLVDSQRRRCKVPFRYNRVMCQVTGDKTLQELAAGDKIDVDMEFVGGVWKILKVAT